MNQQQQIPREKLVYLRQWVGRKVAVKTVDQQLHEGALTNIVFDGSRLMYIMLDEKVCINFEHIIEVCLV